MPMQSDRLSHATTLTSQGREADDCEWLALGAAARSVLGRVAFRCDVAFPVVPPPAIKSSRPVPALAGSAAGREIWCSTPCRT